MKTLALWAAAAAVAASGPAFACSPSLTPFSKVVDEADFAFRGRAKVRFDRVAGTAPDNGEGSAVYAGEATFKILNCYAPPKGQRRCPRSVTVPFTAFEDGHNCPSWVLWFEPSRERYFTLERDEAGQWQLGGAWRRFER